MKRWLLAGLVAFSGCGSLEISPPPGFGEFGREVVAADHAIASEAGAEILRAGGNAVDAAVATSFALSVVRAYSCGIGGGGFMVIHLPEDPVHGAVTTSINYRETAPGAVGADFYADGSRSSVRGGTAVGVPGTVAGLLYALERYGTLDRATVMGPAIRAAEEGFVVDEHYVTSCRDLLDWFGAEPGRRERFEFVWERYLREGEVAVGDVIASPEQAGALRMIAAEGAGAFYEGEIGREIVAVVEADGGVMAGEDLAGYEVVEQEALRFRFRVWKGRLPDATRIEPVSYELITMGPPSSGGIAIAEMFGILDRLEFGGLIRATDSVTNDEQESEHVYAERAATVIEAMKHAFADRARWLGDPRYVDVPTEWLLSDERLDEVAQRMTPGQAQAAEWYGSAAAPPDDGGTSHFCVADAWGGVVSCTETINLEFGSLLAVDEFGIVLNNEMDDFTARPGEPNAFGLVQSALNAPAPGKRPLSSMSPTIMLDGEGDVVAVAGASGGPRIISSTFLVLSEILASEWEGEWWFSVAGFYSMYLFPRFHHQWQPDVVYVETWPDRVTAMETAIEGQTLRAWLTDLLTEMGYEVHAREDIGNVQYIVRTESGWIGVSDPRKGGEPAGR